MRATHQDTGLATAVVAAIALATSGMIVQGAAFAAPYVLQHTFHGEVVGDQFGFAVAPVGDVNDDGFADYAVGANVNDELINSGGKAYLYLGGGGYPASATSAFAGAVERGYVGGALAGGADLDGDGIDDWVVGAPGVGVDGAHPGQVYVFLGGAAPDAEPDLVIGGSVPGGQFGAAVCLVPDLDGDGHGDLVVGAPRAGNGEIRIYRGGPSPLDGTVDRIVHARAGDRRFGESLAVLPDLDGDGRDELLVGVPKNSEAGAWAGAVLLFEGTADLDSVPDLVLRGEAAGDEFGSSLSVGADADGDGEDDVLVGAPFANIDFLTDAGRAYLFRGGAALDTIPDLILMGATIEDRFGSSVALGIDWDGDGSGDLAVGASGSDAGALDGGACSVFLGGADLDAVADTVVTSADPGVHLGMSIAAGGDLRHNGRGTLLVGGYNAANAGRILLLGSDALPSDAGEGLPGREAVLSPAWPNPFNPQVRFVLGLPEPGTWRVAVHDLRGRELAVLHSGALPAGDHLFVWRGVDGQGRAQPSGVYLMRAEGPETVRLSRATLVR